MGHRLTVLRVQALSVGVEPLKTGERLSGHVAINQHAASLPRNYLVHFSEHNWDESAACCCAVPRAVPVGDQRQGIGGAGGQEGRHQKEEAAGGVHCHKLSVRRHPTGKRLSFLSAVHLGYLSITEGSLVVSCAAGDMALDRGREPRKKGGKKNKHTSKQKRK